jgi:hypothetical protein
MRYTSQFTHKSTTSFYHFHIHPTRDHSRGEVVLLASTEEEGPKPKRREEER